jgi:hypothetical protein
MRPLLDAPISQRRRYPAMIWRAVNMLRGTVVRYQRMQVAL